MSFDDSWECPYCDEGPKEHHDYRWEPKDDTPERPRKGHMDYTERPSGPIVACGSQSETIVLDTRLCPPAREVFADQIQRRSFVNKRDTKICHDKIIVTGQIDKLIPYCDCKGKTRTRLVTIPIEVCVSVPGVTPDDKIVSLEVIPQCGINKLMMNGSVLHQVFCVKVEVAVTRMPDRC